MRPLISHRSAPDSGGQGPRFSGPCVRASRVGVVACTLLIALGFVGSAEAHPLAPMLFELVERGGGQVDIRWKEPVIGTRGLELAPDLPGDCRLGRPAEPALDDAGIVYRWQMVCPSGGLTGRRIGVEGLAGSRANVLMRLELEDGRSMQTLLTGRRPVWTVPEQTPGFEVAWQYVALGVSHLAGGPDHLLFLACLLLLVPGRRALIATITAFTAGHAVTLTLAALGRLTVDETVIEVGIAFSIVLLAAELASLVTGEPAGKPGLAGRRPWAAAFAFGLLHGLGFASALAQVGLPSVDLAVALAGFNIGIELGQLIFIGALFGLTTTLSAIRGFLSGTPQFESARMPGAVRTQLPLVLQRSLAYGIGVLAAYWCIERVWVLI